MAIKFPLKFRGIDVRNLEDLRKNFELTAAVDYFRDGRLLKWLEARYYDDEAEKISELDENAPNFREKLCAALSVKFSDNTTRLEEKIAHLRKLTDDQSVIANAAMIALTQEDLADLLDEGTHTIYLCGKIFSIPIRVRDKNYIGILDAPTIKIRANSQVDLDDQNIRFENVILPWDTADSDAEKTYRPVAPPISTQKTDLQEMFEVIFGTRDVWAIVDENGRISTEPTPAQKKMFIKMICGEYSERDIIYLRAASDFSAGWALTKDAFCVGGNIKLTCCDMSTDDAEFQAELNQKVAQARQRGRKKIFYRDITEVTLGDFDAANFSGGLMDELLGYNPGNNFGGDFGNNGSFIKTSVLNRIFIADRDEIFWSVQYDAHPISAIMRVSMATLTKPNAVIDAEIEAKIVKFLEFAKG